MKDKPKEAKKAKILAESKPLPNQAPQKQVVMLTSRVHPGETGASWMIHGLMETLLNP